MDPSGPATRASPALNRYYAQSSVLAAAGVRAPDTGVEDLWLPWNGQRIHCDFHRAKDAVATVVFQPGSGSYARFNASLGQVLARERVHFLGVDRPGHGWSDGARGVCTVQEALAVADFALEEARQRFGLPVVLMGSSLGGVLTGCALLAGSRPDLAIAHNFVLPGRLISMRLRARAVRRWRRRPYSLGELTRNFRGLSGDPVLNAYLHAQDDPQAAWDLSVDSLASLFAYNPPRPVAPTAPLVLLTGAVDRAIPAWATRWFTRWAGLRPVAEHALPGAGHMLFHDHLPQVLPLLLAEVRQRTTAPLVPATGASAASPTTAAPRAG